MNEQLENISIAELVKEKLDKYAREMLSKSYNTADNNEIAIEALGRQKAFEIIQDLIKDIDIEISAKDKKKIMNRYR
ncbi:MAG: hypothetical protein ACOZBH_04505 [Patescibacteria group bacterium]